MPFSKTGPRAVRSNTLSVQFDLSSLPPRVTIDSATMSFTTDGHGGKTDHTIDLYALLDDWVEIEATWNERKFATGLLVGFSLAVVALVTGIGVLLRRQRI